MLLHAINVRVLLFNLFEYVCMSFILHVNASFAKHYVEDISRFINKGTVP